MMISVCLRMRDCWREATQMISLKYNLHVMVKLSELQQMLKIDIEITGVDDT